MLRRTGTPDDIAGAALFLASDAPGYMLGAEIVADGGRAELRAGITRDDNQMVDSGEPIPYMERTRQYYRALGYAKDYVWARHDDVPFARLPKPLAECRLALITTANPADHTGKRQLWSAPIDPPPSRLHTATLAWDKESTHTDDVGSFLPIEVAAKLAREGVFASLAPRFHGVPTDYSQRSTTEEVAPQVLRRLRDDGADAAILCPL
jgi:hypothetical protein